MLQIRKRRLREGASSTQDHTASEWDSGPVRETSDPGLCLHSHVLGSRAQRGVMPGLEPGVQTLHLPVALAVLSVGLPLCQPLRSEGGSRKRSLGCPESQALVVFSEQARQKAVCESPAPKGPEEESPKSPSPTPSPCPPGWLGALL